jgi:hypothetical protein
VFRVGTLVAPLAGSYPLSVATTYAFEHVSYAANSYLALCPYPCLIGEITTLIKTVRFRYGKRWRGQNIRGIATLALGAVWCCGAAAASLRPSRSVPLVSLTMAPLAWLAAAALHLALWTRRSAAPVLYLALYWFLTAASAAAILYHNFAKASTKNIIHVEIYIQGTSLVLSLMISAVDCVCFYDEVCLFVRWGMFRLWYLWQTDSPCLIGLKYCLI